MFGISAPELIVIGVIALLVFGPDKLPDLARLLGRVSGEAKKHSDALRREFYNTVYTPAEEIKNHTRSLIASPLTPPAAEAEASNAPESLAEKVLPTGFTDVESPNEQKPAEPHK